MDRDAGRLPAARSPAPRTPRARCPGPRRASVRRKPSSRASSPSRDSVPGPKTRRVRLACSNGSTHWLAAGPEPASASDQSWLRFMIRSAPFAGTTLAYTELPSVFSASTFFSLPWASTTTSPSSSPR